MTFVYRKGTHTDWYLHYNSHHHSHGHHRLPKTKSNNICDEDKLGPELHLQGTFKANRHPAKVMKENTDKNKETWWPVRWPREAKATVHPLLDGTKWDHWETIERHIMLDPWTSEQFWRRRPLSPMGTSCSLKDGRIYTVFPLISSGFYFLPRPWRLNVKMRPAFNRDECL